MRGGGSPRWGNWPVADCLLPLPAPCSGVAGVLCHSSPKPLDSSRTIPLTWFVPPQLVAVPVSPKHVLMQPGRGGASCARVGRSPRCFLCSAWRVLPHCPSARGRADRRTPPVAQPLPLIPLTKKGKLLREGSLPHAVASAAAVTFSLLLVARVPDLCAGCQGNTGPMERPVKDGILYVQHCKFGKVKGGFGAGCTVCPDLS